MDLINHLSSVQGRRDQGPNRELARKIADNSDTESLTKLLDILTETTNVKIQQDILLTLAALCDNKPEMLVSKIRELWPFMMDKDNRSVFATMIIFSHLVKFQPDFFAHRLILIIETMDKGSVVTRDHGFKILLQLYEHDPYHTELPMLILEQIMLAPANQLGQYAETLF